MEGDSAAPSPPQTNGTTTTQPSQPSGQAQSQSQTQNSDQASTDTLISNQTAPVPTPAPTSVPSTMMDPNISAAEIALYDRQIRLWGVQAQEKIRTANVLLIGLKGLGTEVAKNLVLAGIGSLTVIDDGNVTEDDLGAQFFVRQEDVGTNRAQAALPQIQKLNPRVNIKIISLDGLFQNTMVFGAFTLVIATDMSLSDYSTINAACRVQQRPFYAAATHGMYGYVFVDLISHDFVVSRDKSNKPTQIGPESATRSILGATSSKGSDGKVTEMVTKREIYTPIILANTSPLPDYHLSNRRRKANVTPILSCLRALWEYQSQTSKPTPSHSREDLAFFTTLATTKHKELQLPPETLKAEVLRSFLQNLGSELSPVCAFLGGQLAQDVINVIGGKEQPIQNMLVFDGEETKGLVYALHSEMMLGMANPAPLNPMTAMPSLGANGMGMPMMGMPMGMMPADLPLMPDPGMAGVNLQSMPMVMPDGNIQNLQPATDMTGTTATNAQPGADTATNGTQPPA